ncbi:MAG: UTP--glucose-1-phosphate uridylyltransferase GalU [Eubacteriales bacterium]|nr:UTP--glucose-1-phosphate uridylyltransferase GalU [Eubacteriales bacterium]
MKRITKAVIPAAGMGTRFLPATKAQPKEMLPVVDKPTIQYLVEEAVASGIEDVLIITGRNKRSIEDHFDHSVELEVLLGKKQDTDRIEQLRRISDMANIYYVRQKEPLGLGHAILCAKQFIGDEPFAVMLGDDMVYSQTPCLRQLLECYEKYGGTIIGGQKVSWEQVSRYGIIDGQPLDGRVMQVSRLVEKPDRNDAPSNLAVLGRYVLGSGIFALLEQTQPGKGGEIQLTDALDAQARQGGVYALDFDGRHYDIGNKQGFLQATVEYALRDDEISAEFLDYLRQIVAGKGQA